MSDTLGELADVLGDGAAVVRAPERLRELEATAGAARPTAFSGTPGTELARADQWMGEARGAIVRLGEIEAQLPHLEQAAERQQKESMGKWILLAAIAVIALAIVIGQLI